MLYNSPTRRSLDVCLITKLNPNGQHSWPLLNDFNQKTEVMSC